MFPAPLVKLRPVQSAYKEVSVKVVSLWDLLDIDHRYSSASEVIVMFDAIGYDFDGELRKASCLVASGTNLSFFDGPLMPCPAAVIPFLRFLHFSS